MVAYSYFREGQTKALRQEFRDHLMGVTKDEVKKVAKEQLDPSNGIKTTFASESLIKNEKPDLKIEPI